MDFEQAATLLAAAEDSPFAVEEGTFAGRTMRLFKNRDRSLRDLIQKVAVHGDKDCLVAGDRRISATEFVQRVWGAGHALQAHGLHKGDRIGILAMNQPDWLIALFGAASVGGVTVGLNGWWTAEELVYGLNDSGCRFLIVDEHLYERAKPALADAPSVQQIYFIGDNPPEGTLPISALLEPRADAPTVEIAEEDPFVILYTSGTTGRSKGCITTHGGTIAQVTGILYNIIMSSLLSAGDSSGESTADEAVETLTQTPPATLLTSPLFHVAALHSTVCTSLTAGAKLVFGPPKFDPEATMALIEQERVTSWMAIPTLLHRLVDHPAVERHDLSSIQSISTGGAPTPPELAERARTVLKTRPSLSTTYGLTECHGMASSIGGKEYEKRPGSVGRTVPVVEVKIVDEAGQEVPRGQSGEILLYGPTITPGYWNKPEATAQTVRDGWLHTGDIGYVDDDGFLYISDRAKDMILRGGENVYCVEVENCLSEHPEIEEAAIIGVPDPDLGERVKAVVVRRPESILPPEAVQAHVAAHLAKYKVPAEVEFIDKPLPRNPAGKILKNLLRGQDDGRFTESL